jgi:microcystin-dependent protein
LLYTNVINTWAPVSGGRTGDPVADFVAGKTLTLPRQLSRVSGVSGNGSGLTSRAVGEFNGSETHTLIQAELPNITLNGSLFPIFADGGTSGSVGAGNNINQLGTFQIQTPLGGSNTPFNIVQPSSFAPKYIKL